MLSGMLPISKFAMFTMFGNGGCIVWECETRWRIWSRRDGWPAAAVDGGCHGSWGQGGCCCSGSESVAAAGGGGDAVVGGIGALARMDMVAAVAKVAAASACKCKQARNTAS